MTKLAPPSLLALSLAFCRRGHGAARRSGRAAPAPQRNRPSSGSPSSGTAGRARQRAAAAAGRTRSPSTASTSPAGKLAYTATAGTLSLFDQSGERSAAIFYTAYVAKNAEAANRPVTFAFNGGPGAASAFLHLGLVGPRIAEFAGNDASATARLQRQSAHLARLHRPGA